MTEPEPGSREYALLHPGSRSQSWIEADGPVAMSPEDVDAFGTRNHATFLAGPVGAAVQSKYLLDYSGARPNLTVAKSTGATCCARYIAPPVAATAWKRITVAERDSILKTIGDLWLNWEWYEGRCLEGATAGTEDGKTAVSQLTSLSYPHGRVIPVSHDTGTVNDPAVQAYFTAFKKQLGGTWGITAYGGYHTVTMLLASKIIVPLPWQTLAWSNGQRNPQAAVFQNGKQWFSNTVDENVIYHAPFGAWNSPLPVPKPPVPPAPAPITGYYHHDGHGSTAMVSPDGDTAAFLLDDGRIDIRKYDPSLKHGVHQRYA